MTIVLKGISSPPAEQKVAPTHRILTSLILNSEHLLSGSLPDEDGIDHEKTDTFKSWLPSHSDVDLIPDTYFR